MIPKVEAAEMPIKTVEIGALIKETAAQYGVNANHLYATVKCESDFNITARGDGGHARGLAQIRDDYHPEVSDEEADSPEFAIDFMAKGFANGQEKQWSCWRQLDAKGW